MYKVPETIVEIVRGTQAKYLWCEASRLIYEVETKKYRYEFPIDVTDRKEIGNAIFTRHEKSIHLMRYINMAIKIEELKWVIK